MRRPAVFLGARAVNRRDELVAIDQVEPLGQDTEQQIPIRA